MLLSPNDVLEKGMWHLNMEYSKQSVPDKQKVFHKHFGSSTLVLANMWYDMTSSTTIIEARISKEDLCDQGFKMLLVAHFFLWTYIMYNLNFSSRSIIICEVCYNQILARSCWLQLKLLWMVLVATETTGTAAS